MKSRFLNRGYPSWFINKQMKKVKHLNDRKKAQKSQGVPLVITDYPLFKTFGKIRRKHLNLLYVNEEEGVYPMPHGFFSWCKKIK